MTAALLSQPEAAGNLRSHFDWLLEVLACPACRHQGEPRCRHLESHFSLRDGIVYPADQEALLHLAPQRKIWESLEKARGTYDLPMERLVLLPEENETRAVLDWLRTLLRGRGPLRILQLYARCGWAARALAEDGHQVVAGDVLDDPHIGLGCAVRLRDQTGHGFACVQTGATALPFHPESFDCVFCFDTLRQISDLERLFQEVSRVLRPGGLFLALQEPFRGVLTTQTQRLLDTTFYRVARWWLPGKLSRGAEPEMVHLRSQLGASLHDMRRRVPFYLANGEAAGLQTTVLPTAVALSLSPDFRPATAVDEKQPAWLGSLARAYALDVDRLRAMVERASQTLGYDLLPELQSHWVFVGNMDGVLLARKGDSELSPFPTSGPMDPERCRRLDPLLLACTADGFLPIYGVYPVQIEEQDRYSWIQPQAGLLVPASASLEVTVRCPAKPFCDRAIRIDFRLETERLPLAVVVVEAGKKVTLKLPIPASAARHASLFVGITSNFGFLPSDFNPAPGCDTRLLAVQLHAIRAGQSTANDTDAVLRPDALQLGSQSLG
jgi:hypothetical protein